MEARLAPLAIARVIYGLRFGDFLTKAIHSQNLSRMSTLPVSDYWSWLREASPTNPTNRVMTGASACIFATGKLFRWGEENADKRHFRVAYNGFWFYFIIILFSSEVKYQLLNKFRNKRLGLPCTPNQYQGL